ncbi:MAG: hypothetical protein ACO1PB_12640 [Ramlibacter sp.]
MSGKAPGLDWLAGGSLGLLVGLLTGLSVSPVASIVVGAVAALLGGVFGLAEKASPRLGSAGGHRLTAFALATVVALVAGILLRTHHVLSPSPQRLRAQLADIGIQDTKEQNEMLRFLRFGLLPTGVTPAGKEGKAAEQAFHGQQGVLYAEGTSFCASLRTAVRRGDGAADVSALLDTGGPAAKRAAVAIRALPATEQAGALRAAPAYLCVP